MTDLFVAGAILYVKDYEFEDDKSTRNKYMIVLYANEGEAYIIHSLTTSQNKLFLDTNYSGCSIHKSFLPYFFFPKKIVIGEEGFYFDEDTFIFFLNNIRKEKVEKFAPHIKLGLLKIGKLDSLSSENLKRLLKCVLKHNAVPTEILSILQEFKNTL